jgi:hypothetical protein
MRARNRTNKFQTNKKIRCKRFIDKMISQTKTANTQEPSSDVESSSLEELHNESEIDLIRKQPYCCFRRPSPRN